MILVNEAIIALGTNMGNRMHNICSAIKAISILDNTIILRISGLYETEPVGVKDYKENFINCCLRIETKLSAIALLGACLGIEAAMGRVREHRLSSRIIDIDLLMYSKEIYNDGNLILPHPRIRERCFVLLPLNDVCDNSSFYGMDFKQDLKSINKSGILSVIKDFNPLKESVI